MPTYIKDGVVHTIPEGASQPWTAKRVAMIPWNIFWGIIAVFVSFFSSLFGSSQPKTFTSGGIVRQAPAQTRQPGAPAPGAPRPSPSNVRGMGSLRPDPCAKAGG
jgi:hypothetical protein